MHISKRAMAVTGSLTLKIDAQAKQMKAAGESVIGFGAGEPDFDTPAHIVAAAKAAMDAGKTRYTPAGGTLELREAICADLAKHGLEYTPKDIVVGNGAKQCIHNALLAMCELGDEVIVPSPYWVSYPELIHMAGAVVKYVKTQPENGFNAKIEDIDRLVNERTRAIILNSPGNPCGNIYGRDELEAIADIAVKNDIYIISDEIYNELVYDGGEAISIATLGDGIKQHTVVVNGASKSYAMTGWRMGYTASEPQLAGAMTRWQSHATSNPNSIAQAAYLAALSGEQQCVADMKAQFEKRRNYMVERINRASGISCIKPKGAFYVMMNISQTKGKQYQGKMIDTSDAFAEMLLQKAKVAVIPGSGFGDDDYVRMSYAASMEDIEEGMDRIEKFVSEIE